MVLVHSTPFLQHADLLRLHLERHGITCALRNEHLARGAVAPGPGVPASWGSAPPDAWVEVWVADAQANEAQGLTRAWSEEMDKAASGTAPNSSKAPSTWTCDGCGEVLEEQFGACWQCGRERS